MNNYEIMKKFRESMKRLSEEDKTYVAEKLHKRNIGISKGYLKPANHR